MRRVSERLEKLSKLLEREPDDAFLVYGLAMEHKKLGEHARAIELLDRVIALDPGYCYAYYQKGMTLESAGEADAAKSAYRAGIDAAKKKGDAHAQGELEAALAMME
jgi:tetratricopeptide (TPR) repeat protein